MLPRLKARLRKDTTFIDNISLGRNPTRTKWNWWIEKRKQREKQQTDKHKIAELTLRPSSWLNQFLWLQPIFPSRYQSCRTVKSHYPLLLKHVQKLSLWIRHHISCYGHFCYKYPINKLFHLWSVLCTYYSDLSMEQLITTYVCHDSTTPHI